MAELKTIEKLVARRAKERFDSLQYTFKDNIRRNICTLRGMRDFGDLGNTERTSLDEKIVKFLEEVITDEMKQRFIDTEIVQESSRIMDQFKSLQRLCDNELAEL